MHDYYSGLSVENLIEEQRRLARSSNHFEQVIGTLLVAGALRRRLAALPNQALGHLVFEFVSDELAVLSPELTICQAAVERLYNSSPLLVETVKEEFNL